MNFTDEEEQEEFERIKRAAQSFDRYCAPRNLKCTLNEEHKAYVWELMETALDWTENELSPDNEEEFFIQVDAAFKTWAKFPYNQNAIYRLKKQVEEQCQNESAELFDDYCNSRGIHVNLTLAQKADIWEDVIYSSEEDSLDNFLKMDLAFKDGRVPQNEKEYNQYMNRRHFQRQMALQQMFEGIPDDMKEAIKKKAENHE